MSSKRFSILVPARLESSRLPKKLALSETGKPLLVHSLENLQALRDSADLWLVTDAEELAAHAEGLVDGVHLSTREFHSGTERIAEVLPKVETPWVLNVQADEPEIDVSQLRALMNRMVAQPELEMGTLGVPFESEALWKNPNAVKVLLNQQGCALYFSRAVIPHGGRFDGPQLLHHLGVYAYRTSLLERWGSLPVGVFEKQEKLEQLRAIENGISIVVVPVSCAQKGIDTREDYSAFVRRFLKT